MTNRRRIEALRAFGYTPREAAFIGVKRGRPDHVLVRKAVALGHCASRPLPGGGRLHHLASRPLFAALGEPDNRNRRPRPPAGVLRNLMRLDFAVEHRDLDFLVTEREKVAHFLALPGVEAADLPVRIYRSRSSPSETRRRFVDKTPVFLRPADGDGSAATGFCYVEAGASSVAGFETLMNQYRSLLARLPVRFWSTPRARTGVFPPPVAPSTDSPPRSGPAAPESANASSSGFASKRSTSGNGSTCWFGRI
jgi:hypothetical protein